MTEYDFPTTPITEDTFERQGWEMVVESEVNSETGELEEFYYFVLPIPKDTPDETAPVLISSANDDWETLGINEGEYFTELDGTTGLGLCTCEEELEILYRALTKTEIE